MRRDSGGSHTLSRLAVIGAALLFSTGGAAIKACHLSGWQVASFRSGIAVLAILLMVPEARRRWSRDTWMVGLAYAGTMVLYVLANKLTTAANTIFLQDTAPLYILLLGPLLLGERARSRDLGFMVVMAAGMLLFFVGTPPPAVTAPRPMAGNILALAAGVCWALTIMGLRHQSRGDEGAAVAVAAVACGNLIAFLAVLPLALPVASASPTDWALVVFLGVVQIGLAYVLLTHGVRGVPALEASLLLLVEPVLNPIWAWLIHGENPGLWSLLGGGIILSATAVRTLRTTPKV